MFNLEIVNRLKKFLSTPNLPAVIQGNLADTFYIPEPTRHLVFITDEDPSKASSPFTLTITISIENDGVKTKTDTRHNFFGEPSLIWKKLSIRKNNSLEDRPIYYPSYNSLSPEQRYQYVSWLRDITQPTNLSYVFLYYYGLERQLLIGDFDSAVREVFRLLKHHDKGTFRAYAQDALVVAILHHDRLDLFKENSFLFDGVSNEILLVRRQLGEKITPRELIGLSSRVGFYNKRYLNKYPEEFLAELEKLVVAFEYECGSLLEYVNMEELKKEKTSVFANFSLPDKVRSIEVPQLLSNEKFKVIIHTLLEEAHEKVKGNRKARKSRLTEAK